MDGKESGKRRWLVNASDEWERKWKEKMVNKYE